MNQQLYNYQPFSILNLDISSTECLNECDANINDAGSLNMTGTQNEIWLTYEQEILKLNAQEEALEAIPETNQSHHFEILEQLDVLWHVREYLLANSKTAFCNPTHLKIIHDAALCKVKHDPWIKIDYLNPNFRQLEEDIARCENGYDEDEDDEPYEAPYLMSEFLNTRSY